MADSSSRLGLCITVRPGSHKAGSVEDLRWRERTKYLFKYFFLSRSFVFNGCWVIGQTFSSSRHKGFHLSRTRAQKFPLLPDYFVIRSICLFATVRGFFHALSKKMPKEHKLRALYMCYSHRKQFQPRLSQTVSTLAPCANSKTSNTMEDREITEVWMPDGGSQACPSSSLSVHHSPPVSCWQAALQGDMTWKCSSAPFGLPVTSLPCSSTMHEIINSSCTIYWHLFSQWKTYRWIIVDNWDHKGHWWLPERVCRGITFHLRSLVVSPSDPVAPIYRHRYVLIYNSFEREQRSLWSPTPGEFSALVSNKRKITSRQVGVLSVTYCQTFLSNLPLSIKKPFYGRLIRLAFN